MMKIKSLEQKTSFLDFMILWRIKIQNGKSSLKIVSHLLMIGNLLLVTYQENSNGETPI
jgi:hypothetical protein